MSQKSTAKFIVYGTAIVLATMLTILILGGCNNPKTYYYRGYQDGYGAAIKQVADTKTKHCPPVDCSLGKVCAIDPKTGCSYEIAAATTAEQFITTTIPVSSATASTRISATFPVGGCWRIRTDASLVQMWEEVACPESKSRSHRREAKDLDRVKDSEEHSFPDRLAFQPSFDAVPLDCVVDDTLITLYLQKQGTKCEDLGKEWRTPTFPTSATATIQCAQREDHEGYLLKGSNGSETWYATHQECVRTMENMEKIHNIYPMLWWR
jgi:hypothetical protein